MKTYTIDEFKKYTAALTNDQKSAAFNFAVDNRNMEINLYWSRTTYFWGFLVVIFGAYGFSLTEKIFNERFQFLLAIIGIVFSFAWYCVNRGSKFWQKNWEMMIDILEEDICGNIYKTNLAKKSFARRHIFRPFSFSVSQINQNISIFVFIIWLLLAGNSFYKYLGLRPIPGIIEYISLIVLAGLFIIITLISSKRNSLENITIIMEQRQLK
jgi:hypothetical protein